MMKFEELNDDDKKYLAEVYWDKDRTYDDRMSELSGFLGKSERTVQVWLSKLGITEKQ